MSDNSMSPADQKEDDRKALGDRLRQAREYLGYSQDQVAIYLGVPRSALSLLEAGQRKLDALELKKIASLYRRPIGYFTNGDIEEAAFGTDVRHLARQVADLSAEDRDELRQFADFLRVRKQKKEG